MVERIELNQKFLSPVHYGKLTYTVTALYEYYRDAQVVVDVGCGEGAILAEIAKKWNVLGIDPDAVRLKLTNLNVIEGFAEHLPIKDGVVDVVTCIDVLEHVQDDVQAMKEIHRVLKKNCYAIITVPNMYYPWLYDPINKFLHLFRTHLPIGMWGWEHRRLYSKEILKVWESFGFEVMEYQGRSHALIAGLVNYIPYIIEHVIRRKHGSARQAPAWMLKVSSFVCRVDSFFFDWTQPINHCVVLRKK